MGKGVAGRKEREQRGVGHVKREREREKSESQASRDYMVNVFHSTVQYTMYEQSGLALQRCLSVTIPFLSLGPITCRRVSRGPVVALNCLSLSLLPQLDLIDRIHRYPPHHQRAPAPRHTLQHSLLPSLARACCNLPHRPAGWATLISCHLNPSPCSKQTTSPSPKKPADVTRMSERSVHRSINTSVHSSDRPSSLSRTRCCRRAGSREGVPTPQSISGASIDRLESRCVFLLLSDATLNGSPTSTSQRVC